MRISVPDSGHVLFSEINFVSSQLLKQLPQASQSEDPAVKTRLSPSPTGTNNSATDKDWREHVGPEIEKFFKDAGQIVEEDLQKMAHDDESGEDSLAIPMEHLDAWMHVINRARIVLSTTLGPEGRETDFERPEGAIAMLLLGVYQHVLEALVAIAQGDWDFEI